MKKVLKKVLKKVYCEKCQKYSEVTEDTFFCPDCGSVFVEQGERIVVDESKKQPEEKQRHTTKIQHEITILEGSSGGKKLAEQTHRSAAYSIFSALSVIALFVAFCLLRNDIADKVYVAKSWIETYRVRNSWGVGSSTKEIERYIYFITPENYKIFSILCVISPIAMGISLIFAAIRKIKLYPIAARKLNSKNQENKYYEGLTNEEKFELDEKYHLDYYYSQIRVASYVKMVFLSVCVVLCFVVGFLVFDTFYDNFDYAKNCMIHFMQGDSFDVSKVNTIGVVMLALIGTTLFYWIVCIVFHFRNKALNNRSLSVFD